MQQFLNLILSLFSNKNDTSYNKDFESIIKDIRVSIDWTDPKAKVSKYFTVHEAIYLPSWNRLANESDGLNDNIKNNLLKLFIKMDKVRELFNKPVVVHVSYRPEEYNKLIGGAPMSAHKFGEACDFHVLAVDCDEARDLLLPQLELLDMRMEDKPKSNWVHLGNDYKTGSRFFKP